MKKFFLIALLGVISLAGVAQSKLSSTATKPTSHTSIKRDTTVVPLYLIEKHDTLKNINVFYADTVYNLVRRARGYQLYSGFWSDQLKQWANVKPGDVYVYGKEGKDTTISFKVLPDYLLAVVNPNAPAQGQSTPAPTPVKK